MIDVGIKVKKIDLISTIIFIVKYLIIASIILTLAMLTSIFIMKYSNNTTFTIIGICIVVVIWIIVLGIILSIEKPFISSEATIDATGNIEVTWDKKKLKFNFLNYYDNHKASIYQRENYTIVHIVNLNNKYDIQVAFTDESKIKIDDICTTNCIKSK